MKILFVCKANIARSQLAEEIFNALSKNHTAVSAGLNPDSWEGRRVKETLHFAICAKEKGYDIDNKISKKLTKEMVNDADKIYVFEKENWPDYLTNNPKVRYITLEDPGGKDRETTNRIIDQLIKIVKNLSNESW